MLIHRSSQERQQTWHPSARLVSDASLSFFVEGFVEGRILESPRRSRDLNVHGRQSKPGFRFSANMAIMRLWKSISASQKNLNEAHKLRISVLAAEETFQMHGSCRCPLLAQSRHAQCADECLLWGAKRTWPSRRKMSASDPKRTSSWA